MSDAPRGDGWWQASDGRWYPPDAVPGTPPPAAPPPAFGAPAPGPGPGPGYGVPPQGVTPGYGPPPQGGAPGYGPPPAVPTKSSRTAWIVIGSILALLILVCGGCGLVAFIGARDAGIDIRRNRPGGRPRLLHWGTGHGPIIVPGCGLPGRRIGLVHRRGQDHQRERNRLPLPDRLRPARP